MAGDKMATVMQVARATSAMGAGGRHLYTIGHSTRSLEAFMRLLLAARISCLVDVRTIPRSRHTPQFNQEPLRDELARQGIAYLHLSTLGGLRKSRREGSPNTGWRSEGFRAFADYMQTAEFVQALEALWELAGRERAAIMCAEAVYWRCHRSLIADAFLVRGGEVAHILSDQKVEPHRLTAFAVVNEGRITYPPPGRRPPHLG
jgi:uncharacterized protein (DUF488 family)